MTGEGKQTLTDKIEGVLISENGEGQEKTKRERSDPEAKDKTTF